MSDLPIRDHRPVIIKDLHWFSPEWSEFLSVAREHLAAKGFVQIVFGRLDRDSIIHRAGTAKTLQEWLDGTA